MTNTRIRLRFKKFGDKIFISHLDFMRLFERALRRAQIPVSMTKGFNPRHKLSFPLALQLGIEGRDEVMELELDEFIKPIDLLEKLKDQLPDGITLGSPELISLNLKSKVTSVEYKIEFETSNMPEDVKVDDLLNQETLNVYRYKDRSKKKIDIRPSISSITKDETGIIMNIKATNRGMAKPKEVLIALGIETKDSLKPVRIIRTHVNIKD
ncbi:MAG: TIGR03936 family radical SAM-associated protein [Candidatus Anammoxibacter sp.]